ncbi:hypothetical protein SNEBB_002457 [Seison nebaliae]|nr:hypothetical protein SNEBB_002457 [Seison nebaliae]
MEEDDDDFLEIVQDFDNKYDYLIKDFEGNAKNDEQPMDKKLCGKFRSKMVFDNLDNFINKNCSHDIKKNRYKDKSDRATVEQVLDPRTRMIILKFTGKEANVYHSLSGDGDLMEKLKLEHEKDDDFQIAVKIYKTSILVFKDRQKYVEGEFRYRNGFCRSNPRKMVKTWAEKEFRNLSRMYEAKIPSPLPIIVRNNVLLMEFIGDEMRAAPKLKDVFFEDYQLIEKAYFECLSIIRLMYVKAKLIHADLSEFNLLYFDHHVVVIDVSQSVEHNHPMALKFLRSDITNINNYFRKQLHKCFSLRKIFFWVVSDEKLKNEVGTIVEDNMEQLSDFFKSMILIESKSSVAEDETFKDIYLPQTLNDVIDYERDIRQLDDEANQSSNVTSKRFLVDSNEKGKNRMNSIDETNIEKENIEESEDISDSVESNIHNRKKDETLEEKRERKKLVKEAKAEKRKDKIPKHVKKRHHRNCVSRKQN